MEKALKVINELKRSGLIRAYAIGGGIAIFKAKAARRRKLARLPFEEKIRILVRLQRIAAAIRKDHKFRVWRID